jgi:creatinine amidohydrolase
MEKMNETNEKRIDHLINDSVIDTSSVLRFDQLTYKQIDALNRSKTLFFLPISPLEEHGPHLPVGTDLITAQDTAISAIKQIQRKQSSISCILLPAIPLGYAAFSTDFPGTVSVSSRVVRHIIFQYGKMLARHGFQHLLICTYHMALGHLKGIYAGMKKLRRTYNMSVCEPWSPLFYSGVIAEEEPAVDFDTTTEVHAGFRETSLMAYTHPSLVDKSYKELPLVFSETLSSPKILYKKFKQIGITDGYVGTPSKANKSYGRWFFNLTVNAYIKAAESMINGQDLPDLPKHIKRQMNLLFWL